MAFVLGSTTSVSSGTSAAAQIAGSLTLLSPFATSGLKLGTSPSSRNWPVIVPNSPSDDGWSSALAANGKWLQTSRNNPLPHTVVSSHTRDRLTIFAPLQSLREMLRAARSQLYESRLQTPQPDCDVLGCGAHESIPQWV